MSNRISRRVPRPLPSWMPFQRFLKTENRMLWMILICLCMCQTVFAVDNDPATHKTLKILQINFKSKPPEMQRTLLRNMALLNTDEAVPFFVGVALDASYEDEIRREALKGLLALDSKKYRSVLEPLQDTPLQEDHIIRTVQLLDGVDLLEPIMSSLHFNEDKKTIDLKISSILNLWNNKKINAFNFKKWPSFEASDALLRLIQTTDRESQKIHLIVLWSKVRDEKSTKEIVKLLDQNHSNVQEAVIKALSEPGPSAVSALGRFLQKSKDATLRKRTIFALRKINSDASKVALKSYLPHATADEKKSIEEALGK